MFVRLTSFGLATEKAGEIKRIYLEEVAPVIREQPGLKDVMLLESADNNGEFLSCTIWEHEAAVKAFESSSSYPEVFGKIKAAATTPPSQKYYNTI